MISACAKVARGEDQVSREFPLHVEVVLHRVRELGIVGHREKIERQSRFSVPGVEKLRENELLRGKERRQFTVDTESRRRELIAIDAESAPYHSFGIAEDVPCKARLR